MSRRAQVRAPGRAQAQPPRRRGCASGAPPRRPRIRGAAGTPGRSASSPRGAAASTTATASGCVASRAARRRALARPRRRGGATGCRLGPQPESRVGGRLRWRGEAAWRGSPAAAQPGVEQRVQARRHSGRRLVQLRHARGVESLGDDLLPDRRAAGERVRRRASRRASWAGRGSIRCTYAGQVDEPRAVLAGEGHHQREAGAAARVDQLAARFGAGAPPASSTSSTRPWPLGGAPAGAVEHGRRGRPSAGRFRGRPPPRPRTPPGRGAGRAA